MLLIGPYVGSWKEELLTFRPFAKYLSEKYPQEEIFISSHFNRRFLYDWIPTKNFIQIPLEYSLEDWNQKDYRNKKIDNKEFNKIKRDIKCKFSKNCLKNHFLPYNKLKQQLPTDQKKFTKIKLTESISKKNDVLLIVNNNNELKVAKWINDEYPHINIISGVTNNRTVVKEISSSYKVICSDSIWTFVCNLQGIEVFSWGEFPGPYKTNGMFNFGNKITYIPSLNDDILKKQINKFLKN